jgi:thiamine biosynthesis lipoprotein
MSRGIKRPRFRAVLVTALYVLLTAFSAVAVAASGRTQLLEQYQYTEIHMGVPVRIVVYAPNSETAERACRAAYARFAALEDIFSDYRPTSELMLLCQKAGGPPVPVSAELFFVLQRAQKVAAQSDGAFDMSVGPLVQLWRTARKEKHLPSLTALREAKARVGWRNIVPDEKSRTVRLTVPGMRLDAGAIAKGYACDEAQKELKRHGLTRALVEAGGDIVVSGPPPGQSGWKIDVDGRTWTLANRAISTSGDTNQFVEIGGKRYSHIVDPRTGLGLTNRIAVTITAPDGITSDSLSTVVSVLGEEKGRALATRYPGVTTFIRRAEERSSR